LTRGERTEDGFKGIGGGDRVGPWAPNKKESEWWVIPERKRKRRGKKEYAVLEVGVTKEACSREENVCVVYGEGNKRKEGGQQESGGGRKGTCERVHAVY